ncbi:MAG: hypothetical protein H0X63_10490 [Flavobacteriales bacterium]|nr:hypothetical protein [Flavobacteriales bacterium]
MEEALYNQWYIGLAIATVIIIIAAILLTMIWVAAKRILKLANAALGLVIQIKENTKSIWELEDTNKVAVSILNEAKNIRDHAGLVAGSLEEVETK